MNNVTYLLGAGASANCLPVINQLPSRLLALKQYLKSYSEEELNAEAYKLAGFEKEYEPVYLLIQEEFDWLYRQSINHQTVDTLAKKFYHRDHDSLLRLKRALISFFILEQLLSQDLIWNNASSGSSFPDSPRRQVPDLRYDSFIASILENDFDNIRIRSNVKIVTWNYDVQFELAFRNYAKNDEDAFLFYMHENLQIVPSRRLVSNPDCYEDLLLNRFALVKLNGHAIFDRVEVDPQIDYRTIFDDPSEKEVDKMNKFYKLYDELFRGDWKSRDCLKLFTFSWEQNPEFPLRYKQVNETLEFARKIARETDILVVIGYSFPFFNRETDRQLVNSMDNLKKVYIQDMPNNVNNIASIFKSSFVNIATNKTPVIPINYVNSFFLPPEL